MSTSTRARTRTSASRKSPSERHKTLATHAALVLGRLNESERQVLMRTMGMHDGHPASHADTASALGMTVDQVRDLEKSAIKTLQATVGADAARQMLAA